MEVASKLSRVSPQPGADAPAIPAPSIGAFLLNCGRGLGAMKALPKDEQYLAALKSGRHTHSDVWRCLSDTMWLLLVICGIVLTMWALDEIVERVWGPATVNGQTAWRFESTAERAFEYVVT